MPFWRCYYHLVWATKNRQPLITPEMEPNLYRYMISKAGDLGASIYAVNGWTEHSHLIVAIPPKLAVATFVKRLKGATSHFVNHTFGSEDHFAWQRGYGALTLGETQRAQAEEYVQNQKQRHADRNLNSWLEKYFEFDEGPPDEGLPAEDVTVIREQSAEYSVEPVWTFP